MVNPRPPLFNWFVAVPGVVLSPLFGDVWQSVTTVLILSTAVWGALTIFPTYFLTKNIFGRRAGLIAAFLLAVMPAHLQRSQATDADHDSMTLFFVVTCFYFFMKALKLLSQRRWVASWNVATKDGRSSIFSGLTTFFRENKRSVLYSVMAGLSMTTVALIWQGWAYVPIILLIYIVLQLFVDRIRNQDPMGMGICFSITMIITFLLSAPWYVLYGQIKTWFDVPLILFLVAAALGFFLTVTRNYPWVLVVPTILLTGGVILAALVVANPAVANAFVSGAGYFVRTKLYETIAEAQPPGISQAILSFGAVTYFFSLLGLLWMIIRLPKRLQPDYMFVLTWSFAAIFMSMAAARFIFNASPAFAVSAGWMIAVVADWIDFDGMRKTFSSLAGGSKFVALRKSVKPRHIIGTLVVVFLLFLPNVWTGVDASIPYEDKAQYERQIFNAVPGFARPPGYTPPTGRTGSTFYLGMFGYSLPLPNSYFPSAWDWFAKQDANVPMEKRPAYLSWWDYGFEAVDRGEHPTVADNFQDGYQLAGQFITAQSEDQAIALLILKLIEGDFYKNGRNFSPGVVAVMQRWGIDPAKVLGAYRNPSSLSSIVLGDPITYGRWDSSMQPLNALYIYLAQYFDSQTTTDQMASFYHDIMEATGWSIRYFGVDSRLFPYDGGGNNIFYAPVKLSDHRVLDIPDGRVLPVDFFSIEAQTDKGTFPVQLVPLGARTSSLNIKYTDMFYKSMFYRAYMGFSPTDVGATCSSQDCLPGIRGDLQSSPPMQAWNLSHFKVVYKTVYYNPWPTNQVQNHTDAWQAMNYFDALDIQREISQGTATGVVDFTNQTMAQSGAVFIKYYDGAYVNGTVTVDGVTPLPGVRVTVSDYEDPANPTPHYTTFTDSEGRYSLLAPFGTVRVVASTGTLNQRTQVGATVLDTAFLIIGDYQAMRRNVDGNGDGIPDYMITQDLVVGGVTLTGHAFLDINNDKNQTVVDEAVANCPISLRQNDLGLFRNMTTNSDGTFIMTHAYPGVYTPTIDFRGRLIKGPQVTVGQTDAETNVPLSVSKLEGTVLLPGNITASGATVLAYDEAWGNSVIRQTDNYGKYSFDILPGNFTVSASYRSNASIPQQVGVFSSSTTEFNITLSPSGFVSGKTSVGGVLQGYVLLTFDEVGSGTTSYSTTSAADGSYFVRLPAGTYDVHARHYKAGSLSAFLGRVVVPDNTSVDFSPSLSEGVLIRGVGYSVDKSKGGIALLNVSFSNGAGTLRTKTSSNGNYMVYLPQGDYVIQVGLYNLTHLKRQAFVVSQDYDIVLEVGTLVRAQVYYDIDGNGFVEPGEGVADAHVTFTDSSGVAGEAFTDASGRYQLTLPSSSVYVMRIAKSGFLTFTAGPGTLRDLATRFTSRVIPANITVTGRLSMQGLPFVGGSVEVDFNAKGSGAVSAIAVSDTLGAYAVSLAPGSYEINVDQPISPGQDDMRFQTAKSSNMILRVGQGSIVRDIPLFMRAKVTGTVGVHGSLKNASMVFQGPEGLDTTAGNGAFSVMLAVGTYTLYANYSEGGTTYAAFQQLTISAPLQLTVDLIKATTVQEISSSLTATYCQRPHL